MFGRKVLKMDQDYLNRLRRFTRAFYRNFDQLFVLNTDQQKWLSSEEMGFDENKVKLTAHWAEEEFHPRKSIKPITFGLDETHPVVLYAGRISHEKGVLELPFLYKKLKKKFPDIKFVILGDGPASDELKKEFPEAIYMGWVDHKDLPDFYSAADMLALPSKFDTFSCVVLEALSCGLPVIAYKTKGPKDIILDGENGYLVSNRKTMVEKLETYFNNKTLQQTFKLNAINRGKYYNPDKIIRQFIEDTGLKE
jgi:glycosyltransferase involved in cell wall biosynthesis